VDAFVDLLRDNDSVGGRLATSALLIAAAVLLGRAVAAGSTRRVDDPYTRYHVSKAIRYVAVLVALIGLAVLWQPFAGRIGVVLGLAAAGVAFAMQEVIGAVAGWFNILSGRIFRVGDRIEMGGVRGDVIDITPLRTKILEIGGAGGDSWVKGRQHTGRIVAVSNKATFTEPVYNFSAAFEYLWEELAFPISHRSDWSRAEQIMREELVDAARTAHAERAISEMRRRYPVPRTELEPRVFVRVTDNWVELSARFVVPIRSARTVKDELTRTITERFEAEGIEFASETLDVTVRGGG
jgi:small-conductance mechanosensitive channel